MLATRAPPPSRSNIKVRTINSLNRGCQRVQAGAHTIKVPIYAQHGTADLTCTLETIQHFLALVSTPQTEVTLKEVEGGLHDLNRDPCTPECVAAMIAWLHSQKMNELSM